MLTRSYKQIIERCPTIPPLNIEAGALAQFRFFDLAPPPRVQNVLVPREDSFQPEDYGPVSRLRPIFKQRSCKTLRSWERMVVTDKNDIRRVHHTRVFLRREHSLVCAKCLTEIPKILLAATAVRSTNLSLYTDQGAQLRFVSPRSESGWTRHVYCEAAAPVAAP